jgi:hypothetical protein
MPDDIDRPINPFDRYRNAIVKWAAVVVVFGVLPVALWWAGR